VKKVKINRKIIIGILGSALMLSISIFVTAETGKSPVIESTGIPINCNLIIRTYSTVHEPSDLPWNRYGVVLNPGKPNEFDDKGVESPLIVKLPDNTYVMFYRGQSRIDEIGRVMRAVSKDGKDWTKTGVVMVPTELYEGDRIDPMAVIFEEGIYKMWYGGQNYGGCACYATSSDGINWTKYISNPVLRKTSGAWDNGGAGGQLSIIKVGSIYNMYYKGFGDKALGWTYYGLAESKDGMTWSKKGKSIVPQPELGETTFFKNLFAFYAANEFFLMHTMDENLNLYLKQSNDGKTWNNNGLIYRRGLTDGNFDAKWATSPCVILDGNVLKMWYEGGDYNGRVRTLYAEINWDTFFNTSTATRIVVP
jgi:predicted GH43/DUF377 family glycosyl hydrolase